ncbi:MAG: hypothetical protein HW421_312 [Ignavibacteria bacterium]|nr:hypothetical protein [Ignavibacteria bacterium]
MAEMIPESINSVSLTTATPGEKKSLEYFKML